jgi:hypothetical protein
MANITIVHDLPFESVIVGAKGRTVTLHNILFDTGSASTIFRTDDLGQLGIVWDLADNLRYNRGIGGVEAVIEKQVDFVELGTLPPAPLTVEMGPLIMDLKFMVF